MIIVKDLSKIYSREDAPALSHVDLALPDTGLFFIIGPSGSGKSTLLNLIGALDVEYDGELLFCGADLKTMTPDELRFYRARVVTTAFQGDHLEAEKTVLENVESGICHLGDEFDKRMEKVREALDKVGLSPRINDMISTLSGGEKKRVGISRALARESAIYLFDEPLSGLEKEFRQRLKDVFCDLAKRSLVLVVTHQKEIIKETEPILEIVDGRLSFCRRPPVFSSPVRRIKAGVGSYRLCTMLKDCWLKLKFKKMRTLFIAMAIDLGLMCYGLSSLLLTGVKESVVHILSDNITKSTLAVEKKDYQVLQDEKKNVYGDDLEKISAVYHADIEGSGNMYSGDLKNMFPNGNSVSISCGNREFSLGGIGLEQLLKVDYRLELDSRLSKQVPEMNLDEIAIAAGAAVIRELSYEFGIKGDLEALNKFLAESKVFLLLKLINQSWEYRAEVALRLVAVLEGEDFKFLHSDPRFATALVEDELRLLPCDELESACTYPWSLKRRSFLIAKKEDSDAFISSFLHDHRFSHLQLERLDLLDEGPCMRLAVFQRERECLRFEEIQKMLEGDLVESYMYSSKLYQCGDSRLSSGFYRPLYLARDKEKINSFIDANTVVSEQSFVLQVPNDGIGVVGGDILSNARCSGYTVEAIGKNEKHTGTLPINSDQILISTGLAKALNLQFQAGTTLNFAFLKETTRFKDRFQNKFIEGRFVVTGTVEAADLKIYQSSDFLRILGVKTLGEKDAESVDRILLKTPLPTEELILVKEALQNQYPEYYFSIPGVMIENSVNPVVDDISKLLLVFSAISLVTAAFLLGISVTLRVEEDRHQIGIKLALGYRVRELKMFYVLLSELISLGSSLGAVFGLISVRGILQKIIGDMFGYRAEVKLLTPVLVIVLLGITVGASSGFIASRAVGRLTPLSALKLR